MHLCPWDRTQFDYKGLNTHSPLSEKPKGIELTFEEAATVAEEARQRHRRYMLAYNKKWNKAKMDAVRGVRTGVLSITDTTVKAWVDQHDAYLARSKKSYGDMKEIVAAVKAGTMTESDEGVEKALKRQAGFQSRNTDRSRGLELIRMQKNGELDDDDIDTETEKIMEAGRMQQKANNNYAAKRKKGVALARQIDAGEVKVKNLDTRAEEAPRDWP